MSKNRIFSYENLVVVLMGAAQARPSPGSLPTCSIRPARCGSPRSSASVQACFA